VAQVSLLTCLNRASLLIVSVIMIMILFPPFFVFLFMISWTRDFVTFDQASWVTLPSRFKVLSLGQQRYTYAPWLNYPGSSFVSSLPLFFLVTPFHRCGVEWYGPEMLINA